jgi:STE24 endopeptidase
MTALLAFALSAALGLVAQSYPPATRAADQIPPVSRSWYDSLPRDPASTTASYLTRVPVVMRERGEAIGRSRYWALAARIVASLSAILLFLYSGAAHALDVGTARLSRRPWVRDFIFSITLLVFVFSVTLPVEVGASYIRYRTFGFSEQPFAGWMQDYAIGWASTAIFYAVGITILMAVIRRMPRTWFLCAGAVYLALALLYTAATPMVIEPLTNTYTALPDSMIKRSISPLPERRACQPTMSIPMTPPARAAA